MSLIQAAIESLQPTLKEFGAGWKPLVGIILGSGLGGIGVQNVVSRDYQTIPGFKAPGGEVEGHAGKLELGFIDNVPVAVMNGRLHLYQGLTPSEVVAPVRVLARLGCRHFVITAAVGGIAAHYKPGDIVILRDFINFSGHEVHIGPHDPVNGPYFPDMSEPFSHRLQDLAVTCAETLKIPVHKDGVYYFMPGRRYETPSEVRAAGILGGTVLGMSMALEVSALAAAGVACLGIAGVANMAAGISKSPLCHSDVLENMRKTAGNIQRLICGVVSDLK